MTSRLETDVVVIGAGFSGLAAADAVSREGLRVVVLEARDRVGGRVAPMQSDHSGRLYDAGAGFVFDGQDAFLGLVARHGLETESAGFDGDLVSHVAGMRHVIDPTRPFDDAQTARTIERAIGQLVTMAATFPSGSPWLAPDAAAWDSQTFRTWTLANIAEAGPRFAVEAQFANALGGNPGQLSLLAILDFIQSIGGPGLPPEFRAVPGGLFSVAEVVAEQIGDDLVLGSPVREVNQTDRGVVVSTDAVVVEAGAVIVALSPALLDRIRFNPGLPLRKRLLTRRWLEVPGIKAVLEYERPFWQDEGLSGMATADLPAASFVQALPASEAAEGVLVCFYNASETADWALLEDADLRASARLDSLEKLFGQEAGRPLAVCEYNWLADDWSAGCSFGVCPGVWTQCGPALREPHGRVHWAGTETAQRWQGSVEGAAVAGERAARDVASFLRSEGLGQYPESISATPS